MPHGVTKMPGSSALILRCDVERTAPRWAPVSDSQSHDAATAVVASSASSAAAHTAVVASPASSAVAHTAVVASSASSTAHTAVVASSASSSAAHTAPASSSASSSTHTAIVSASGSAAPAQASATAMLASTVTRSFEYIVMPCCRGKYSRFKPLELLIPVRLVSESGRTYAQTTRRPFVEQGDCRNLRPPFDARSGSGIGIQCVYDDDAWAATIVANDADIISSMSLTQINNSIRSGDSWWLHEELRTFPVLLSQKGEDVGENEGNPDSESEDDYLAILRPAAPKNKSKPKASSAAPKHSKDIASELVELLEQILGDDVAGPQDPEPDPPEPDPISEPSSSSSSSSSPESEASEIPPVPERPPPPRPKSTPKPRAKTRGTRTPAPGSSPASPVEPDYILSVRPEPCDPCQLCDRLDIINRGWEYYLGTETIVNRIGKVRPLYDAQGRLRLKAECDKHTRCTAWVPVGSESGDFDRAQYRLIEFLHEGSRLSASDHKRMSRAITKESKNSRESQSQSQQPGPATNASGSASGAGA